MSTEFMGSATPPPVHPEPVEGSFEDFCKRSYVEALQMSDYKRGGRTMQTQVACSVGVTRFAKGLLEADEFYCHP